MNVDLPDNGCNILISDVSFYNYSSDRKTRKRYYIYDGIAHLENTTTTSYTYDYSGSCLSDGDLVYKPELKVYFPVISFCIICFILLLIYRIFLKRLLP